MSELHSKLNTEALAFKEEWPYIPHLTIVKMSAEPAAQTAFQMAREALVPLFGKPPHPAGKVDLCARRHPRRTLSTAGSIWPPLGRSVANAWFRDNLLVITALLPRSSYSRRINMALGTSPSRALKTRAHGCR